MLCSPKKGKKGWKALYSHFGHALSTWTVDMSWFVKVRDYNALILFLMNGKSGYVGSPKAAKSQRYRLSKRAHQFRTPLKRSSQQTEGWVIRRLIKHFLDRRPHVILEDVTDELI